MKNEIKDINEVIIRFLDGTATGEEKVFLFNWLENNQKRNRNEFSEDRDLGFEVTRQLPTIWKQRQRQSDLKIGYSQQNPVWVKTDSFSGNTSFRSCVWQLSF